MISDFTVSFFVKKYMILNIELSCQLSVWSKVLLLSYKPQKIRTYNVSPDKILSYCGTNDNGITSSLLHILMIINTHKIKHAILIFQSHIINMLIYCDTPS